MPLLFSKNFSITYFGSIPIAGVYRYSIIKMLVDSLVLSHMDYTLPVWGYSIISTFNPMSATSPKLGWPHHHVTSQMIMYHSIALLLVGYPLPHQVKHRSLCAMYHQYSISLDPPILFGTQHSYRTCCPSQYAHLPSTQKFFRYSSTLVWLPPNLTALN